MHQFENVQLIVVSPLYHTLHTATLIFGINPISRGHGAVINMVALVCIREWSLGKDKPITEYRQQFPTIDFSHVHSENDNLWTTEEAPLQHLDKRISEFTDWLKNRKETNIVLVGHNSFISRMLHGDIDDVELLPDLGHCQPVIKTLYD